MRPFVEVAGEQLGQQGLGDVSHTAQDEAGQDLQDGGPSQLHILLPLLAIGKGHQEQQQRQAGSQEASHRFLQDTTFTCAALQQLYEQKFPWTAVRYRNSHSEISLFREPRRLESSSVFYLCKKSLEKEAVLHMTCATWHRWSYAADDGRHQWHMSCTPEQEHLHIILETD